MPKAKPSPKPLTPTDAHRAIYIDFEGFKGQPPSLLGMLWAQGRRPRNDNLALAFEFLDPTLDPLVDAVRSTEPDLTREVQRCRRLDRAMRDLVLLAEAQNRLIVSWSTHDRTIAEQHLDPALFAEFDHRYRDGKATSKRWAAASGQSVTKGTNQLVRYLALAGYPLPDDYGAGVTTKRIGSVLNAVAARGEFPRFVPSQRAAWAGLLHHNFVDCHGMRHVVTTAARALA